LTGKVVREPTLSGLEPAGAFVDDTRSDALELPPSQWVSPLR
jgi:hypothetical protein